MENDEIFGSDDDTDVSKNEALVSSDTGASSGEVETGSDTVAKEAGEVSSSDVDFAESSDVEDGQNVGEGGGSLKEGEETSANVSVMAALGGVDECSHEMPEKRTLSVVFGVLLLMLTLVVGYLVFSNKSVVGAWKIDKNNDNKGIAALVLNSDGTAEYTTGSYAITGEYKCEGEKLTLTLDGEEEISGEYKYRVAAGLADRSMELVNSEGKGVVLRQYKLESSVNPVSSFSPKKEILGKWTPAPNSGVVYEFKDNGLMVFTRDNIKLTLTYFVNDNTIDFMQYPLKDSADDASRSSIGYVVGDGVFKMGGMALSKVG